MARAYQAPSSLLASPTRYKMAEPVKLNLLMLGDSSVGKTSLMYRFVEGHMTVDVKKSVGVAFLTKVIEVNGAPVKVQVWDTAGQVRTMSALRFHLLLQERFASVTTSFFRAANGVLVVYDVTSEATFKNVNRWIQHVKELKPDVPVGIIGNKCDLERVVTTNSARNFCSEQKLDFFEASALDGQGVQEAFQKFVERMFTEMPRGQQKANGAVVNPSEPAKGAKSGGSRCVV
jgi:small GTP-binding protein